MLCYVRRQKREESNLERATKMQLLQFILLSRERETRVRSAYFLLFFILLTYGIEILV